MYPGCGARYNLVAWKNSGYGLIWQDARTDQRVRDCFFADNHIGITGHWYRRALALIAPFSVSRYRNQAHFGC